MWYCNTARMDAVDQVQLNFNPATLAALNVLIGLIMFGVALHNALGLALGYWTGRALGCHRYDARAISIEVGIQNSALALVLIFGFFDGLGGMAIIAAWWGVWHLISGLTLATYWSRHPVPVPEAT